MDFLNELKEHKELLALLSAIVAMVTALISRKKIVVHQIEYTTKEKPPLEPSRIIGDLEPPELTRYDPGRLAAYDKAAVFLRSQLATFATVCGMYVVIIGSMIAYQKYVLRKSVELDQPMIAFGILGGVYFVILVIPAICYYLWHHARLR